MAYLFKYYAGAYDNFMKSFELDGSDEIFKVLGEVRNKKIMDIGGGTGKLANELQLKGAEVTLIDPSAEMTHEARLKNKDIIIHSTTLQELEGKLNEEYFDAVILRDSLHHIRKADEIIALSHKYLNATGEIIVFEFDIATLQAKFIWLCETLCFERPRMFTQKGLSLLCNPYFKQISLDIKGYTMLYKGKKRGKSEINRFNKKVGVIGNPKKNCNSKRHRNVI